MLDEPSTSAPRRRPSWIGAAAGLWLTAAIALASLPHLPALLSEGNAVVRPRAEINIVRRIVRKGVQAPRSRPRTKPEHRRKKLSPLDGVAQFSLPVREKFIKDGVLRRRHHDYPAWDIPLPRRTGVHAVVAGRIERVTARGACGKGVIVRAENGFTYTYCHGSRILKGKGQRVDEGDPILLSGSTGNSTGPHLHLQIQRASGKLVCPQPLLQAWKKDKRLSPRKDRETQCYRGAGRPGKKAGVKHKGRHKGKHPKKRKR